MLLLLLPERSLSRPLICALGRCLGSPLNLYPSGARPEGFVRAKVGARLLCKVNRQSVCTVAAVSECGEPAAVPHETNPPPHSDRYAPFRRRRFQRFGQHGTPSAPVAMRALKAPHLAVAHPGPLQRGEPGLSPPHRCRPAPAQHPRVGGKRQTGTCRTQTDRHIPDGAFLLLFGRTLTPGAARFEPLRLRGAGAAARLCSCVGRPSAGRRSFFAFGCFQDSHSSLLTNGKPTTNQRQTRRSVNAVVVRQERRPAHGGPAYHLFHLRIGDTCSKSTAGGAARAAAHCNSNNNRPGQ